MRKLACGAVVVFVFALLGCGDGAGPRPIGATCSDGGQCASGLCGGGLCLDPELDEDLDGLINRIEGALGTDPMRPDSDGDGVRDPDEVGDVATPADSDGDGKIDAVESASADADSDCLADQVDARDGYSDPPSEANPEACGDGAVHCDVNPLAGTCAAELGAMLGGCFRPAGACAMTLPTSRTSNSTITWDNGASLSWSLSGKVGTGRLLGPTGTLCATLSVRDPEGPAPVTIVRVAASGLQFTMVSDETSSTLTCPSGGQVVLTQEASAALSQCSGDTSDQRCSYEMPGDCVSDSDCHETGRCCLVPNTETQRYCMPVETCPTASR